MLTLVLLVLLFEVLLAAVAAVRQTLRAPSQRQPLWVVWLIWNVLPVWAAWRAGCGWVLRRAGAAAVRACDAHDRAQATATYPAQDPGV